MEWKQETITHLDKADIILLLVSADFLASDFCYNSQMRRAMLHHIGKQAHVIPVILRPADWQSTPFGKLRPLPQSGRPITSWSGYRRERAFLEVAQGIRDVIAGIEHYRTEKKGTREIERGQSEIVGGGISLDRAIAEIHRQRAGFHYGLLGPPPEFTTLSLGSGMTRIRG